MKAKTKLLLPTALLLVCAAPASAQLTTVTGTVADPIGVTYYPATIKAQLVTTAGSPVTGQPTVTINNQAQCVSAGAGSIQVCFPTGAVSGAAHDCTDPNVWIWRGSGQIAKVMGRAVCLNANAACGYFPTPMWAAGFSALTIDLAPFTLITTGAFNGDTTAAPGGSGADEGPEG